MNALRMLLTSSMLLQGVMQIDASEETTNKRTAKFAVCSKLFSPYNLYVKEIRESGALLISSDGVVRCTFLVYASEWNRVETRRQVAAAAAREKNVRSMPYSHILGILCMACYLQPSLGLPLTSTLAVLSLWYGRRADNERKRNEWLNRNLYGNFTLLDNEMCKMFGLPHQEGRVWIYDPNFEFAALPENLRRHKPGKQYKSLGEVMILRGHFNTAGEYVRKLKKQLEV